MIHPKTGAAGFGGALAVVTLAILSQTHALTLTPALSGAITILCGVAASYVTPAPAPAAAAAAGDPLPAEELATVPSAPAIPLPTMLTSPLESQRTPDLAPTGPGV